MTKEQILEIQKKHTEIYNKEIKPLYEEIKRKESKLAAEFNAELEKYYDSELIDSNGKPVKVGNIIEIEELQVIFPNEGNPMTAWRNKSSIKDYLQHKLEFEQTGKTRKVQFTCKSRNVQFLFGEMLNNPKIYAHELRNGKQLKKEETFNPNELLNFIVVS